jgi:hypothetical protein
VKRAKPELGIQCYKEREAQGRWFWDACGERVDGSNLRVDSGRVEEVEEVEGIKEFKEVA